VEVELRRLDFGVLAHAEPEVGRIAVNVDSYSPAALAKLLSDALGQRALTENPTFQELFVPSVGDSGTLNHEIHHLRRKDDHAGAHEPGPDAAGKIVSFEAAARSYFERARNGGLFSRFQARLAELAKRAGLDAAWIDQAAGLYRRLETDRATTLLLDALGIQRG
jgi:hypothetical protein